VIIGNRHSINKLYAAIVNSDGLPLPASDIIETADTIRTKNALLYNQLLGSGVLNQPTLSISGTGVSVASPIYLHVDGEMVIIQPSTGLNLVNKATLDAVGTADVVVWALIWYQHLTTTSTLREYGGVNNTILTNDILHPTLGMQASSRYQLRWDIVATSKANYESANSISVTVPIRDATGLATGSTVAVSTISKSGTMRRTNIPSFMSGFTADNPYLIPLAHITRNTSTQAITGASMHGIVIPVSLQYNWNGTQLGIKRADEASYVYVDLKGATGTAGTNGLSVELRLYNGYIQWRQTGGTWANLVPLTDITGTDGLPGAKGDKGDTGPTGPGIAAGGVAGQMLMKSSSTDYATTWSYPHASVVNVTTNTTLSLTHMNCMLVVNSSSNLTITVPQNTSVAFPIGTELEVYRAGSGTVTFNGQTNVVLNARTTPKAIANQYSSVVLKKLDTNTWALVGDIG